MNEPTQPGWYASADPRLRLGMIYLRLEDIDILRVVNRTSQWMAVMDNGEITRCDWGYIEQAGPVAPLVRAITANA